MGAGLLGPTALGITVFYLWPTVRTLIISFTKSGPFGGSEWVGIENYTRLFQDPELIEPFATPRSTRSSPSSGIPLAVGIAALLNTAGLKGRSAYRTLYFIPVVTMPAAIALVWRMIYNGDYGVLNAALGAVGIEGRKLAHRPRAPRWSRSPSSASGGDSGPTSVIFLAGLQGIPDTIMEAADLDGAGPVRKFFSITIPLLSPSIFFVSVISVIGALQVFDLIYMMLGRSNPRCRTPARSSTSSTRRASRQRPRLCGRRGLPAAS